MSTRVDARARLDLHLHSTRSDGAFSSEALLAHCARANLDFVAITDHDMPPSLAPGTHRVGNKELFLIHGTELSGVYEGKELHLLVYFPGPMPQSYRDFLQSRSMERAERYTTAVERLGLKDLEPADPASHRGERAITRQHLAQALVAGGHVPTIQEAFRQLIGNHTGNVPLVSLSWEEALRRSREAGGLTSWAHPRLENAQAWAGRFKELGLQALETRRPRLGRHGRAQLERIALKNGLMLTGGSDWHGLPGTELGQFCLPGKEARPFLQKLGLSS